MDQENNNSVFGKCPHCGGDVLYGRYGFYCAEKCGMRIGKVYGKVLTEVQLMALLAENQRLSGRMERPRSYSRRLKNMNTWGKPAISGKQVRNKPEVIFSKYRSFMKEEVAREKYFQISRKKA